VVYNVVSRLCFVMYRCSLTNIVMYGGGSFIQVFVQDSFTMTNLNDFDGGSLVVSSCIGICR
jgi:hypothetical protein